jgi:hypothetical protein
MLGWGNLDHAPALLDISHYREWYRQLDRIGGAHHLVLLRKSDGQLVSVSEATWDPPIPQRGWQLFTGIRRQWRCGGLAKCFKAVLQRQGRASHPSVTEMITSNASENTAMLVVNARIGFTVFRTHGIYQIERDVLGAWHLAGFGLTICVSDCHQLGSDSAGLRQMGERFERVGSGDVGRTEAQFNSTVVHFVGLCARYLTHRVYQIIEIAGGFWPRDGLLRRRRNLSELHLAPAARRGPARRPGSRLLAKVVWRCGQALRRAAGVRRAF